MQIAHTIRLPITAVLNDTAGSCGSSSAGTAYATVPTYPASAETVASTHEAPLRIGKRLPRHASKYAPATMLARVIGIEHATTFSFISDPALTFDFAFYAHSVASGLDEPAPYQKTLLFPQRNLIRRRHAWTRRAAVGSFQLRKP